MNSKPTIPASALAILLCWMLASCLPGSTVQRSKPAGQAAQSASPPEISNTGSHSRHQADLLFNKAMAFYRRGRYPDARKFLVKALQLDPRHPMALRMLVPQLGRRPLPFAIHLVKTGDTLSGLCQRYYGTSDGCSILASFNNLEHPDRLKPNQIIVLPPQTTARWPKDPRQSLPGIIGKVSHRIKNGQSLSKLARLYYGNYALFHVIASFNDLVDATSVANGSTILIPRFEKIPFRSGYHKTSKGTKGRTIDSRNLKKQRQRALQHFRKKNWPAAISGFKAILASNPHDEVSLDYLPKALFQQARLDFKNRRYLKAKKGFEDALAYDINCNMCEKYLDASIEKYKDLHYQRGIAFFKNEQLEKAVKEWEKVYALDPDYKAVEYNLKHARWKLGPGKPGQVAPDSP